MPKWLVDAIIDLMVIGGFAGMVAGLYWIWPPLAPLIGGMGLMGLGIWLAYRRAGGSEAR